jgi:hypothetical protein
MSKFLHGPPTFFRGPSVGAAGLEQVRRDSAAASGDTVLRAAYFTSPLSTHFFAFKWKLQNYSYIPAFPKLVGGEPICGESRKVFEMGFS